MPRTTPTEYTEFFAFPAYMEQFCEVGWSLALAYWNNLMAPFCPSRDDHPLADPDGQLVIPEPLAEDDEHGLFA